jgi:hypothetical protein
MLQAVAGALPLLWERRFASRPKPAGPQPWLARRVRARLEGGMDDAADAACGAPHCQQTPTKFTSAADIHPRQTPWRTLRQARR